MIVVAVGTQQNLALCRKAGLTIDVHGVVVDDYLQTSISNIYAAGDIIGIIDRITGRRVASTTWPDAMQQGRHAALAMLDQPVTYAGAYVIAQSAFFGFQFASCGVQRASSIEESIENGYTQIVRKAGRLLGFTLIGNLNQYPSLRRDLLMQSQ
jgi:NAD(P)H-nitrite reductase large subunit